MIAKREKTLSVLLIAVQVVLSVLIFLLSEQLHAHQVHLTYERILFISQIIIIWTFLLYKLRLGVIFRDSSFFNLIYGYFFMVSIAGIILFTELKIMLAFGHYSYSVLNILYFCLLDLAALILFKYGFYYFMRLYRRIGRNSRNVIIITGEEAIPFVEFFIKTRDWGYRVKNIITPNQQVAESNPGFALITDQDTLIKSITLNGVDDIFYCLPVSDKSFSIDDLIKEADIIGISVHIMQEPTLKADKLTKKGYSKNRIFDTHQTVSTAYFSLKLKEMFDVVFSTAVIVGLFPLLLLIALLIKLEDGGPVFFRQERVGQNGRRFTCIKFRSMVMNAEELQKDLLMKNESDGPTFKIGNDPRITRIGRFIRKTSIDELPQFYNVMKGEMSVVGPRPPILKEVLQYERSHIRRLSMKPGLTCIWQVSGRNSIPFKEWMRMDLEYIDNWTIWLDIKIIFKTVAVIFKADGQ